MHLAGLPEAELYLCPSLLDEFLPKDQAGKCSISEVIQKVSLPKLQLHAQQDKPPYDYSSFTQRLVFTRACKRFAETPVSFGNNLRSTATPKTDSAVSTVRSLADNNAVNVARVVKWAVERADLKSVSDALFDLHHPFELNIALGKALPFCRILASLNTKGFLDSGPVIQMLKEALDSSPGSAVQAYRLFLVMFLQSWNDEPVVLQNTTASHALTAMSVLRQLDQATASYISQQPSAIATTAIVDPTRYVQRFLASVERPDTKQRQVMFMVQYPWLFDSATQVIIFRAICFYRLQAAMDAANVNRDLLREAFNPLRFRNLWPSDVASLQLGPLNHALKKYLAIEVNRTSLLSDAFDQIWRRQLRDLLRPVRVRIRGVAEIGVDQGGVAQEFFRLAIIEAFQPGYSLFTVHERSRAAWFDLETFEPAYKFEMLGVLVALAVHNGLTLPVNFPLVLYHKLGGGTVTRPDQIADGWPELAKGLSELESWSDGDVSNVFVRTYDFSYNRFGRVVHVDLSVSEPRVREDDDDSVLVTNDNRQAYVSAYIDYLVNGSVCKQYEAFAQGFHSILPLEIVQTVQPHVLKTLVEGSQADIDTRALERVTKYIAGFSPTDEYIKMFWSIVHSFSPARKAQLLEFVTASDRIPPQGIDSIPFTLQMHGIDDDQGRLPTAVTCFGRLLLPVYPNKKTLRAKLKLALANSQGFGLS